MSAWSSWPSTSLPYTLHSYVTEDKFYCVHLALAEDGIRERVPTDRVAEVRRLIHPANSDWPAPGRSGSIG